MKRTLLTLGLLASALAAPSAASAAAPGASTGPVTGVTDGSAVLHGTLTSVDDKDRYQFAYGPTTAYGATTALLTLQKHSGALDVSAPIQGLTAGTTYHATLLASDKDGHTAQGADVTFTTAAPAPIAPAPITIGTPRAPGSPGGATPTAVLGASAVVGVEAGTVRVRVPGTPTYTAVTGSSEIPVGSLIDTRAGTVRLQTATPDGSQGVTVHGGLFQVRQAKGGDGVTDLVLRGSDFSGCAARPRAAASSVRPRTPTRSLWAHDRGGRFRTQGRGSVAAVRGTRWVTTDTCAGTRTRVTEGAVAVYDRRLRRTVVVRAGHSYLARVAAPR